jgi:hypothetical protein
MNFEIDVKSVEECAELLHWARRFKKYDLMKKLLHVFPAALPSAENIFITCLKTFQEDTVLTLAPFLNIKDRYPYLVFDAICFEMNKLAKILIDLNPMLVYIDGPYFKMHNFADGTSLLHASVLANNLEIAEYILEKFGPPPLGGSTISSCKNTEMFLLLSRYKMHENRDYHFDIISSFLKRGLKDALAILFKTYKVGVYSARDLHACIEIFNDNFIFLKDLWCMFIRNVEPDVLNEPYYGNTALDYASSRKFFVKSLMFYGAYRTCMEIAETDINWHQKKKLLLLLF